MFYHSNEIYNTKAAEIIVPILIEHFHPRSVIDVGCGLGTWLNIFSKFVDEDYLGIDSEDIDINRLFIPKQKFHAIDVRQKFNLDRKYDLVISLEVAEHLPEEYADVYIKNLVSLGDTIVFSAAIPYQGGQNHINEKWPNYWVAKFKSFGFFNLDILRPLIWDDQNVEWWYKQNMMVFTAQNSHLNIKDSNMVNLVHPNLYELKSKMLADFEKGNIPIRSSFKLLFKSLINKLRKEFEA